jgi:putative modified peptide
MPTLKLDTPTAAKLVDLLATDDKFRDLFVADMPAALAAVGYAPDNQAELLEFVRTCCSGIKLADKDTITQSKEEISKMLTSGGHQSVPALDANQGTGRSLK